VKQFFKYKLWAKNNFFRLKEQSLSNYSLHAAVVNVGGSKKLIKTNKN